MKEEVPRFKVGELVKIRGDEIVRVVLSVNTADGKRSNDLPVFTCTVHPKYHSVSDVWEGHLEIAV